MEELCLPEQPQLGQQGWVGAAFLGAGLTCHIMLGAETPDLCQDLPGESKNMLVRQKSGTQQSSKIKLLLFLTMKGENKVQTGSGEIIFLQPCYATNLVLDV